MNKKYIKPATAVVNLEPRQPLTLSAGIGGKGNNGETEVDAAESFSNRRSHKPNIWNCDETN